MFSIVIPAFNAQRTIGATLQSILLQTRTDFETIVVDDGSTDETAREVERVGGGRVQLICQTNSGVAAARNRGIAAARGDYISFLDADDVWLPEYLEATGAALERTPNTGLAFTDAWVWDEAVGRFGRQTAMASGHPPAEVPDDPREFFRILLEGNFVFTSTTVPSRVLVELGGYNQQVAPTEDWELWMRIAANGYRAIRAAPVLAVYRIQSGSLSSDREVMWNAKRRSFEAVSRYELDPELRALV
jgi:GT2 family glycosyltransferase